MDERYVEYLTTTAELPNPLVERADIMMTHAQSLLPSEIEKIFVSEFRVADGSRQYTALWFFAADFVSEAPGFESRNSFDCVTLRRSVARYEVVWDEYDFAEASSASTMTLNLIFAGGAANGTLYASRRNCDALRDIVRDYIRPNLTVAGAEVAL